MSLHKRIADLLGWSVEETYGFSLATLRELCRPLSHELVFELDRALRRGERVTRVEGRV